MSTGRNGIVLNDQGGSRMDVTDEVTCTLRAEAHHTPCVLDGVLPLEHHPIDSRVKIADDGMVQTLTSRMGTGGNNVPLVMGSHMQAYGISSKDSNGMKSDNPYVGFYEADTARTLDGNGGNPSCNQGGIAVVAFTQNQRDEVRDLGNHSAAVCANAGTKQQTFVLQGSMIGRKYENGLQGDGINEDVSFTLNTADRHAVYAMTTGTFTQVDKDLAPPIMARDYKDPTTVNCGYTVRRLTPTECARLQGFPDWWCDNLGTDEPTMADIRYWYNVFETRRKITGSSSKPKTLKQIAKWLRDPHSDSAEYRMWGNGVALPCVYFVLSGIAWAEKIEAAD